MKIAKRFYYYLIGFGIGLILTFLIFQGRGCEWLPNARVLNTIQNSSIFISDQEKCVMESNGISKESIFYLLEDGDIIFGESQTKAKTKPYYINNTIHERSTAKTYVIEHNQLKIAFDVFERDSVVFINKFYNQPTNECEKLDPTVSYSLYMPNEMTLEKIRANKLKYESIFRCEMDCNGLTENIIQKALEDGKVLFDYSYPNRKPNPLYFVQYSNESGDFVLWIELGTTKTRLKRIVQASNEDYDVNDFLLEKLFLADKCNCSQKK